MRSRSQARRHIWAALVMTSLEKSSRMRVRRWDEIWDHSWITPQVSGSYHSQVPQKKVGPATLFFTSWRFPKKIAGTRCNVDGIHSKIQQNTQGSSKKAMDQSLQRRVKRESYPCLLNLETEDSCLKKGRCWTWKNPSFSASEKSGWFILGLCILVASFRELKTYKSAVSHHFRDGFSESQIHVFFLEGWCGLQVHDRQSYPHRSLCGHHHEQGETCGLPEKWCQTCIFSPADRGVWVFGIDPFLVGEPKFHCHVFWHIILANVLDVLDRPGLGEKTNWPTRLLMRTGWIPRQRSLFRSSWNGTSTLNPT